MVEEEQKAGISSKEGYMKIFLYTRVALFLAVVFFFNFAAGGVAMQIVRGYARDSRTQAVISQVKVEVRKSATLYGSATTATNGYYSISSGAIGTVTVSVSKSGYQTQSKTINLTSRQVVTVDFSLVAVSDTTPPTGSIRINSDAPYATTRDISLSLSASDIGSGVSAMQFSNDGSTWSGEVPYAQAKAWALTQGDGQKTVYVKFKDAAGNWSQVYSDSIALDMTPPVVVITAPQDGFLTNDHQVSLEGSVDGVSFTEIRELTEGENILAKTATDEAGNMAEANVTVTYRSGVIVGPEGGEVLSADGKVKVIIPAGALNSAQSIKISSISETTLEGAEPQGAQMLGAVECEPYGLVFNQPVSLVYSLDKEHIPGTPVALGLYDRSSEKINPTGQVSVIGSDGKTVVFQLEHFSIYAALMSMVSQGAPIGSGVKIPLPDLLTGAFSHSLPLAVSPGRKGMQPSLSIVYRSSNANSWLGVGFDLKSGYIVRSTRLGVPTYDDVRDTFYLVTDAGTTELVHLIDNLYQAKVESSFSRFYKETNNSWKVVGKDGSVLKFGETDESKEAGGAGTFSWYLTKALDTNGNNVGYEYVKDSGKAYLRRIVYTGNETAGVTGKNSVEFVLEDRTDKISSYISGAKITTAKRLKEIQTKCDGQLVWHYAIEYAESADTDRSLVASVQQCAGDGACFSSQRFEYQHN
jgi:hypothetical protein